MGMYERALVQFIVNRADFVAPVVDELPELFDDVPDVNIVADIIGSGAGGNDNVLVVPPSPKLSSAKKTGVAKRVATGAKEKGHPETGITARGKPSDAIPEEDATASSDLRRDIQPRGKKPTIEEVRRRIMTTLQKNIDSKGELGERDVMMYIEDLKVDLMSSFHQGSDGIA